MFVRFGCSACARRYKMDSAFAGRSVACRGCGAMMTIPAPSKREAVPRPRPPQALGEADLIFLDDRPRGHRGPAAVVAAKPTPARVAVRGYDEEELAASLPRAGFEDPRGERPRLLPAPLSRRFIAYLIDRASILVLGLIVAAIAATSLPPRENVGSRAGVEFATVAVVSILTVALTYLGAFPASPWQGTPGKKLVGIKVVDHYGDRVKLGRSLLRALNQIACDVAVPALIRNVASMLSDADGMASYDRMWGTVVVMND